MHMMLFRGVLFPQGYRACVWLANGTCHDPPGPPKVCNGSLVGYVALSDDNDSKILDVLCHEFISLGVFG